MKARSVGTFVQVGMTSYNMALIREVTFTAECVYLYYLPRESDETPITLRGDVRLAFLDWWERQAAITQDAQSPQLTSRPPGTSAWKVTPGEWAQTP